MYMRTHTYTCLYVHYIYMATNVKLFVEPKTIATLQDTQVNHLETHFQCAAAASSSVAGTTTDAPHKHLI